MANVMRKKGKSGHRSHGRNLEKCKKYKLQGRREVNARKKKAKHAKKMVLQALWRERRVFVKRDKPVQEKKEEAFSIGSNTQERWFRPDGKAVNPRDYNLPYVMYRKEKFYGHL